MIRRVVELIPLTMLARDTELATSLAFGDWGQDWVPIKDDVGLSRSRISIKILQFSYELDLLLTIVYLFYTYQSIPILQFPTRLTLP